MRRRIQLACLLGPVVAAGCGGEPAGDAPGILRHDFGMVPHGRIPEHEFVLRPPADLGPLVPITFRGDCSCTRFQLVLRSRDGSERAVTGYRVPELAIRPDEELILRLAVDTSVKEPVDMEPITSRGTVVLQDPEGDRPPVTLDVLYTYGIDAPVRITPFAHIEFPDLPRGRSVTLQRKLSSDLPEPIRFGPAHCADGRLQATVTPDDGFDLLEVTFTADPESAPRPFSTTLSVETDLDGYVVTLPVSGRVLADITVRPMTKISLGRFDFSESGAESFVNVTDHIAGRDPGFVVVSLRDLEGNDRSRHFAVRLEPLDGDPRTTRVRVVYVGGLPPPRFRGELILAKDPGAGPFVPIEVVAFHRPPKGTGR